MVSAYTQNLWRRKMGGSGKKGPVMVCKKKKEKKLAEWLIEWLTSWSRIILGNLIFQHIFKKFSALYWPRSSQSTPFHFVALRPTKIFSSYFRPVIPGDLFASFSSEIVHVLLFPMMRATCSAQISFLDLFIWIMNKYNTKRNRKSINSPPTSLHKPRSQSESRASP
jgi:hypothetical protein